MAHRLDRLQVLHPLGHQVHARADHQGLGGIDRVVSPTEEALATRELGPGRGGLAYVGKEE